MANQAVTDFLIKHNEERIAELRSHLAPLESGQFKTGSRRADRPEWVDTTADRIAWLHAKIAEAEGLIKRLKAGN